ncbi:MAG: IMP dehydrogenase [Opitutaceae bacterium]|nr:IMP dehydrogenase [Opitutaceae bacterium]
MSIAPSPVSNNPNNEFYLSVDDFFHAQRGMALTYDDVSLATNYSEILPRDASLATSLSDNLQLQIPILSSDMDTVTESQMAIAMALNGGMGLIHYNMQPKEQVHEVARVKRHIHGLIQDPITVPPSMDVGDVLNLVAQKQYKFRTFPVVDENNKLVGLLPGSVVKEIYRSQPVSTAMTPRANLITVNHLDMDQDTIQQAYTFFANHVGITKMLIVNNDNNLKGLITISDVEKITDEAKSRHKPSRDSAFRLVVGAALSPVRKPSGELDKKKIITHLENLIGESVDAVAVSTAHGHTKGVGELVKLIRSAAPDLTIIAGNVTSGSGVEYLADCGANAIKIGQGPGSICTTRVVAGVGIPQLTALYVAAKAAAGKNVRIIADGGITKSGDIVKALTIADTVICGGLLAGCREAPGEIIEIKGKLYKQYRGMGSLNAMREGSAARYGHDKNDLTRKITAEGIEALKEVSGSIDNVLSSLIGGIQSGMGYLGASTLPELREKARFVRVSPAGQREAAPHDVIEISTHQD